MVFEGLRWPKMGIIRLQELFCGILSLFGGLVWAYLGLSWALLGPSWGVQEGILRQIFGLTLGTSVFLTNFWRQHAFRKLAEYLFGGLFVGLQA